MGIAALKLLSPIDSFLAKILSLFIIPCGTKTKCPQFIPLPSPIKSHPKD